MQFLIFSNFSAWNLDSLHFICQVCNLLICCWVCLFFVYYVDIYHNFSNIFIFTFLAYNLWSMYLLIWRLCLFVFCVSHWHLSQLLKYLAFQVATQNKIIGMGQDANHTAQVQAWVDRHHGWWLQAITMFYVSLLTNYSPS